MSTNIRRYHNRFLSAAASNCSRRHSARFPAGKAWVPPGLVMTGVQKLTALAAREREAEMVGLAALLEVVERVDPETSGPGEAAVDGWSVATLVVEVRPLRAAEARFAACVAPAQVGREAETGKMVRQRERA